jgi:hypothetical protein
MTDISTFLDRAWWQGQGWQNRDTAARCLLPRQLKNFEQCSTRGGSLPRHIKINLGVQRNQQIYRQKAQRVLAKNLTRPTFNPVAVNGGLHQALGDGYRQPRVCCRGGQL